MMAFIKFLCLITATECFKEHPHQGYKYVHPCDRDWEHKTLETKLDAAMCCSTVNGRYACKTGALERLYKKSE